MLCIFPVRVTPLPSATLLARKRRGRPSGRRSRRAAISNISLREMALSDALTRIVTTHPAAGAAQGVAGGEIDLADPPSLPHRSVGPGRRAPARKPLGRGTGNTCTVPEQDGRIEVSA